MDDRYATLEHLCEVEGHLHYLLHVFGDDLAIRQGYRVHNGIDAVHFYLCHKFGWKPADVRGMNPEDIRFLLEEELHGWTAPPAARP